MTVPDTLERKLELWREAGRVELYSEGLFYDASWIAVYLGQGVVPERHDPRAAIPDPGRMCGAMDALKAAIAGEVAAMPGHRAYLTARAERLRSDEHTSE